MSARSLPARGAWSAAAIGALTASLLAAPAAASAAPTEAPPEIPAAAPPAAFLDEPELAAPAAWPFSEAFSRTSGTARHDDGALLWTDWLFDDTGDGSMTYADEAAHANGADVFRAGIGVQGNSSFWRVDYATLADPSLPVAVWALDTDADESTGTSRWPGSAGVTSPGSDAFLIMSSAGLWLEDADGKRTDLVARGASIAVDEEAKSFVAQIPRSALRVGGTWTVRLATGIADEAGSGFAAPSERDDMRVYNAAFRTAEQEGERLPGAQMATAWNNGAQSAALASGDIAPFAIELDWRRLARGQVDPEPQPTGFSTRWYASQVDLGPGVHPETRQPQGQPPTTDPRVYGRVQPYLAYVPTSYDPAEPAPVTVLLHGGGGNHNAFRGEREDRIFGSVCEERGSVCLSPLGRGDGTWYVNEAELDVWEVWNRAADVYALDGSRSAIAGHSMGGVGATRFAVNHPDVFAAVGIVSGAGYMSASGGRDGSDDPLRVENLANTRVFMDAGTTDIAEQNTRDWGAAFEDAGVAHRVHYYEGATHGDFGWLGWPEFAERIDGAQLDPSPARIAFRWDPSEARADLGLAYDSAHWVEELAARDDDARWARVEARSGALDTVRTEPQVETGTQAYGDWQAEVRELVRVPTGSVPSSDELELTLENVASARIDLEEAGLGDAVSITLRVTTDGPASLLIGTEPVDLPEGSHTLRI